MSLGQIRPDRNVVGSHYGMGLGNLQLFAQCHHVLGPCNYLITAYLYTQTQKTQSRGPVMPLLIKPRQLEELEAKINSVHQQPGEINKDDEDSEAQRQAKQDELVALESELRPLRTDWDC
ncbi:hypothetical protein BKA60DRAFT_549887 [Fusarium oxysporum]|nr:hypothetical protein BKA60DRAFT_549887 [Fusarium oxysporum]